MAAGCILVTSNEGFSGVLGDDSAKLMFAKGNSADLAEKIIVYAEIMSEEKKSIRVKLRARVVGEHSLPALIFKIVSSMKASRASD
jgi:glycosyltransferase involved in cell wall biosynthesis